MLKDMNSMKVSSVMTPTGLDALRVVTDVNVNDLVRERDDLKLRLEEAETALKEIQERSREDCEKYNDLVWFARASPERNPQSASPYMQIANKYPAECDEIKSMDGDWAHGFNSGVLATSRLYSELAIHRPDQDFCDSDDDEDNTTLSERFKMRREWAIDEFPDLDT